MPETVAVPHLLGLDVRHARRFVNEIGLVLVGEWRDGPPLGALTWPGDWHITSQEPQAGAELNRGDEVVITFRRTDGGDEAPVPAKPIPAPPVPLRAAAEPEDEPTTLGVATEPDRAGGRGAAPPT